MEINTADLKGIRPQTGWKKPIGVSIASSPVLVISRRNEVLSLKLQKRSSIAEEHMHVEKRFALNTVGLCSGEALCQIHGF